MGDQLYPSKYERVPRCEGFTPQSAVSDFYHSYLSEEPEISRVLLYSQYDRVSPFILPLIYDSALATPVSLGADSPGSDYILGLGFFKYIFDSPQNLCPPTPYWGFFGVSGAQVTPPTPSLLSNAHSASQLSSASTPSMNHNIPFCHHHHNNNNNAPILIASTPGQLRPGKRTHELPVKSELHGMQFPHRPLQQHNQSATHFNPSMKRESSPLPPSQ